MPADPTTVSLGSRTKRRAPRHRDAFSELRRQQIVDAATRLFGRKGYDATRADDIAAAAKIAKGTVYLYFKNKEAIYVAAVTHAVRELHAEIARHSAGSTGFQDKLAAAIRVRLEFWPAHEGIYRLLLTVGREPRLRRETNGILRAAHEALLAIFAEGVAAGTIAEADYQPVAWAILDLIRGATERRMDKVTHTSPDEDAQRILDCVLHPMMARYAD